MTDTDAARTADFIETDRFTEIADLKAGWYDGEGETIAPIAIQEGRRLRDILVAAQIDTCVFPTIEGGISLEDTADELKDSFTITINPDGSAFLLSFDEAEVDEDHDDARDLPAASPWLSDFLARKSLK